MWDDTIKCCTGREAEWATACVMDGVRDEPDAIGVSAEGLVDAVWGFDEAMCEDADVLVPERCEVAKLLRV